MAKKAVSFTANGKPVKFKAEKQKPKQKGISKRHKIGDVITRQTPNGVVTMERVRAHGKRWGLKWRIVSNKKKA